MTNFAAGIVVTAPSPIRLAPAVLRCLLFSFCEKSSATPAARAARVATTNISCGTLSDIFFIDLLLDPFECKKRTLMNEFSCCVRCGNRDRRGVFLHDGALTEKLDKPYNDGGATYQYDSKFSAPIRPETDFLP